MRVAIIRRHIFPGGCLPSVAAMRRAVERSTDIRLVDRLDLGPHDATRLRMWRDALDGRLQAARALGGDERRPRMWRFYLAHCEAGFAEGGVGDVELLFARPGASA